NDTTIPGDTADTQDISDAEWEQVCPESMVDPLTMSDGADIWAAFLSSAPYTALHVSLFNEFRWQGDLDGCPIFSVPSEDTIRLAGNCGTPQGSAFSGSVELTSTSTSLRVVYEDFSAISKGFPTGSLTLIADGWVEDTWTDTDYSSAAELTYSLGGDRFEADLRGSFQQRVSARSTETAEGLTERWEGYVRVLASETRAIGDFCMLAEVDLKETCDLEAEGSYHILGAQEGSLTASSDDCDGCMDAELDGVAADPYCQ
ncbi:MAG: hypothetical protein ACI8S6_001807, partial [Myxococcota bacterium]